MSLEFEFGASIPLVEFCHFVNYQLNKVEEIFYKSHIFDVRESFITVERIGKFLNGTRRNTPQKS